MRPLTMCAALFVLCSSPLFAANGISGTWSSGTGAATQVYVFKVQGAQITAIVCGPCDDPATVFKLEDVRLVKTPGNQLTVEARRAGVTGQPITSLLTRVVDAASSPTLRLTVSALPAGVASKVSPIEGRWIAAGRVTQQNFTLKIRDNKVWGLICGPCNPAGVFMIDDGMVEGNNLTFYINHIDTPPSPQRTGLNRNIMRGTLTGNVMKFKWVREGAEDQPGGEMTLIGPIR